MSADGKYALVGDLYEMSSNVNLTENARRNERVKLMATVPDSDWYTIEVWAGAERGDRYTRKPVSELRASIAPALEESLRSALVAPIRRAMKMADDFAPYDLDEAYVGPRSQVGPKPKRV